MHPQIRLGTTELLIGMKHDACSYTLYLPFIGPREWSAHVGRLGVSLGDQGQALRWLPVLVFVPSCLMS